MPKGEIVGNWLSLMSMNIGLMSTDVRVYLEKSPKWSPYGVALSMALIGIHFE
jgi:hypothetical protein